MRIDEASKFLNIPSAAISDIINEYKIEVELFINGNHDLTFENLVLIHSIYHNGKRKPGRRRKTDAGSVQPKKETQKIISVSNQSKTLWYPRRKRSAKTL